MADVIVYDSVKVDELTGGAFVGASINSDGELILEPQTATAVNAGQIGRSVGLGKEIHFTNPDASDQYVEIITVEEESTDQDLGTAPNRWMGRFKPYGLVARTVTWFNEYMEFRIAAAKHNTTALVIYVRENATVQTHARNDTIPLFVLRDDRDLRTHFWGLYNNGIVRVGPNAIQDVPVILLGPTDPIPTGTPNPCIIYRTT
jgi:hypothetical protein